MNYQVFIAETHKKNVTGQADDVYHFNSIAEFFAFLKKRNSRKK
ncbi:hypothetical protein [Providencia hangzhouensis]